MSANIEQPDWPPDGRSFVTVVDAHWTAVGRLLYSMTGSALECADLTRKTFLQALRDWESLRHGANLRAWLFRIAIRAFFDAQRNQQRKSVHERFDVPEQGPLLRGAVNVLSERSRMVFHLRVTENLSFREIADLAGTTEPDARQHMVEARRKLLKHLEDRAAE